MNYTITKLSSQPPKEWNGTNGTVYYITVMLEGHDKPVSIGKKKPDSLKVGDTVSGDIIGTTDVADKFKSGFTQGGRQENPEKDANIARAVALKAAVEIWVPMAGKSDLVDEANILETADKFLGWLTDGNIKDTADRRLEEMKDEVTTEFDDQEPIKIEEIFHSKGVIEP